MGCGVGYHFALVIYYLFGKDFSVGGSGSLGDYEFYVWGFEGAR